MDGPYFKLEPATFLIVTLGIGGVSMGVNEGHGLITAEEYLTALKDRPDVLAVYRLERVS